MHNTSLLSACWALTLPPLPGPPRVGEDCGWRRGELFATTRSSAQQPPRCPRLLWLGSTGIPGLCIHLYHHSYCAAQSCLMAGLGQRTWPAHVPEHDAQERLASLFLRACELAGDSRLWSGEVKGGRLCDGTGRCLHSPVVREQLRGQVEFTPQLSHRPVVQPEHIT